MVQSLTFSNYIQYSAPKKPFIRRETLPKFEPLEWYAKKTLFRGKNQNQTPVQVSHIRDIRDRLLTGIYIPLEI